MSRRIANRKTRFSESVVMGVMATGFSTVAYGIMFTPPAAVTVGAVLAVTVTGFYLGSQRKR